MSGRLGAFLTRLETDLEAAPHGPLAGLRLGVKSNIAVRGQPWTAGMEVYRSRIAERDAHVVATLRAAGARVAGMLAMDEAAFGARGDNPFFGRVDNPRRPGFSPGGSSSGSAAAVGAALCDLALGTDTLGSVRIPAALCGVFGLKPTHGTLSVRGVTPLAPDLDCVGLLASDPLVLRAGWQALSGVTASPPSPFQRVTVLEDQGGIALEAAVAQAFAAALADIDLPVKGHVLPFALRDLRRSAIVHMARLLRAGLGDVYQPQSRQVSSDLHALLALGERGDVDASLLAACRSWLVDLLGQDGALLLPTTPQVAQPHAVRPSSNQPDFTQLASVAGLPAISFPAGCDAGGLPVGLQLVGPAGREDALLALATRLARTSPLQD